MVVCILGSSRSGTSMVTRALSVSGLFLGPEEDLAGPHEYSNPAGYWENLPLQSLNEELLHHLGGSWCVVPDVSQGWEKSQTLDRFRERARMLLARVGQREPWGWKDPRNSLTLPFWKELIPDLKVVVCVRNPMEAASSIRKAVLHSGIDAPVREVSYGLELWGRYQERIWAHVEPGRYIVTHYESWFFDPRAELDRVASWVGLRPSAAAFDEAVAGIDPKLRRNVARETSPGIEIPDRIWRLYEAICLEAGEVFRASRSTS